MLRGLTWVAYGAALAPMFLVAYGLDAALLYLAVYGFELLLSVGHPRLMAMVLHEWKVPTADQPHLMRMSMLYAIATRVGLLLGAALVLERFDSAVYLIGGFGVYRGLSRLWDDGDSEVRRFPTLRHATGILLLELIWAGESLLLLAVTRFEPMLVVGSVAATVALRRTSPLVTAWLSTLVHLGTAATVLLVLGGAKLIFGDAPLPELVPFAIVMAAIYVGYRASRRR